MRWDPSLFIMWRIQSWTGGEGAAWNTLCGAAFVKTEICAGPNDPWEINESIKSKNSHFTRPWRDLLTLINRQMADNQLGGGSSGPAAPQPCEKVTSLFLSIRRTEHQRGNITSLQRRCTAFTLTPAIKTQKITQVLLMFFIYRLSLLSFVKLHFEFTKTWTVKVCFAHFPNVQPHQAAAKTEIPKTATQMCGFYMNISFVFTASHNRSYYINPETRSLTRERIKHADAVITGCLLQSRTSERDPRASARVTLPLCI